MVTLTDILEAAMMYSAVIRNRQGEQRWHCLHQHTTIEEAVRCGQKFAPDHSTSSSLIVEHADGSPLTDIECDVLERCGAQVGG